MVRDNLDPPGEQLELFHTPPMLNERELAGMLNVSLQTLRRWRHIEEGPPYVKAGKAVRYRLSDIQRWIRANTVTPGE